MWKSYLMMVVLGAVVLTGCHVTVRRPPCPQCPPPPAEPAPPEVELLPPPPMHADVPLVYCRRCGVMPGEATQCPNYSSHDFASVQPGWVVVCRRCGVIATPEPTRCPNYSSHDFMPVKIGMVPVCSRCGAAPGRKPVRCTNYSSHDFKIFE